MSRLVVNENTNGFLVIVKNFATFEFCKDRLFINDPYGRHEYSIWSLNYDLSFGYPALLRVFSSNSYNISVNNAMTSDGTTQQGRIYYVSNATLKVLMDIFRDHTRNQMELAIMDCKINIRDLQIEYINNQFNLFVDEYIKELKMLNVTTENLDALMLVNSTNVILMNNIATYHSMFQRDNITYHLINMTATELSYLRTFYNNLRTC